jgi:ABC-type multidrug transport system ATPase subunit
MNYILETNALSHRFAANEIVLRDINLRVPESSIYGFLGPNGAGKTTTLRLILGLLTKQKGNINLFGIPFEKKRVDCLRKIGSLIESPSLYSHLTAYENLLVLQKIHQCPKENIEKVLSLVGLSNTGKKKAGQFSLGMKQRLSIAIALLHDPSLLILDEPTNGLDPNGIIEMRTLLKELNQRHGITILISSHLLSEIEKLVSHVGIINKGEMMFQGTLDELVSKQQQSLSIVFETSDPVTASKIIGDHNLVPARSNGKIIIPAIAKETIASINRQMVKEGIDVYEIGIVKNDLEAIFLDLINK